jgi:Tol biopolymer transport system component
VRRTLRVLATATAIVVAAGGCSDADDDSTPASTTTVGDEVSSTDAPRTAADATYALMRPGGDPRRPPEVVRVLDDGAIGPRVATAPGVGELDVSPDGTFVAYDTFAPDSDEVTGIWTTSLDDPDAVPQRVVEGDVGCPRWFPDGRSLAAIRGDAVVRVDVETGDVDRLGPSTEGLELSCADPLDDDSVVVVATPPEVEWRRDVSLLSLDDGSLEPLGAVPERCIANDPTASPAGDVVVVPAICDDTSDNGLYLLAVDGGDRTVLVSDNPPGTPFEQSAQYWSPAWSTDGEAITFQRGVPGRPSIHVVGRDGTGAARIVTGAFGPSVGPAPGRTR